MPTVTREADTGRLPRHLPARPQPGECSALARAFSAVKGWPRTCTRPSEKP